MEDFDIRDPNVFSDKLRKFETTDKAHADLFNAVVEVLINNDAFLKAVADDYNKKHKTDRGIHITSEERRTWDEKADTSIATNKAPGLLSAEDKTKLDGIAEGANKYTHPTTDGSKHVPATGTGSDEKILMAGSTSGSFSWKHPSFTQATSRANITSGEKLSVSLGKIMKFFADVISKNIAFMTVVNNGTTTAANTLLDGRMGKTLLDKINDLLTKYNSLNSALNSRPYMFANGWSKSLRVNNISAGFHGILIRDHTEIYIVWVAGNTGSMSCNLNRVVNTSTGVPITVSYSESGKYVQFNSSMDCAMVYIGRL